MMVRAAGLCVLGLLAIAPTIRGEDDPEAKKRLALMQAHVESFESTSEEPKLRGLKFVAEPLLRYNDPTRMLLDAGVWRLGKEGRPLALLTIELVRRANGTRELMHEFASLSSKFSVKHKSEKVKWDATESGLTLKPVPDSPKPAATAAARLTQMRQLARRFGAKETFADDVVECRLIAQPIDRYQSEADKITDGAIFALANGTNPEIGIILEADAEQWRYGTVRMSGAKVSVTLDDKEVVLYEKFPPGSRTDGAYANGWKIELGK
jgi:hypothetical protein